MVDIPDARKCCFCLPLRPGLLALGYCKLVISTGVMLFVLTPFAVLLLLFDAMENPMLTVIIMAYIMLIFDITFDTLFIASAHKKNPKYLRIYYRYVVVQLFSYVVLLIAYVPCTISFTGHSQDIPIILAIGITVMLIVIVLHIYFIYLVRSEMRKLQLTTLFSFKSHIDEPECSAQILD